MKKMFFILLFIFPLCGNLIYAQDTPDDSKTVSCEDKCSDKCKGEYGDGGTEMDSEKCIANFGEKQCADLALEGFQSCYDNCAKGCSQKNAINKSGSSLSDGSGECQMVKGIKICPSCLRTNTCGFKIYDLLGIRKSVETEGENSTSPDIFVQDILLSATFFIGTILTIVIIYSGFRFILAGTNGKDPTEAKSGIVNGIKGLLIVICSYAIIRAVQYIAKGL